MSESKTKSFTGVAELDAAIERMGHAKDRDDHHQLLCSLSPIAARHIQEISVAFSTQGFPKFEVLWSLIGSTSLPAVDLFSRAIKDRDPYTRWAASEALAKCDSPLATDCLVAALKDRSTLVKGVAVAAMSRLKSRAAIKQLRKIVQSKHMQTHSPGIVKDAAAALATIENGK